jgi:hypothetical protein
MGLSGEREVRSISFAGGITRRYLRALLGGHPNPAINRHFKSRN